MPGVPLNIAYPTIGEPIAAALGKILTAIQTIQTDLEAKVVPAELSWISDLSAQGHVLSNLAQIQLDEHQDPTGLGTGTVFMDNGDLWVQTTAGVVRITLNGSLNASAIGGISGDFGGANPARVTYTDLTDTYAFTADTNDWSDLEVQSVKLRNSGNWTRIQADPVNSTAQTWTFSTQNASGTALLRQASTGVVGSSATVTENLPISGKVVFSGSGYISHGQRTRTHRPRAIFVNAGSIIELPGGLSAGNTNTNFYVDLPPWELGDRVIGYTVHMIKTSAGSATAELYTQAFNSSSLVSASATPSTTVNGAVSLGVTFNVNQTYTAGNLHFMRIQLPAISDVVVSVHQTYDIP